MDWLSECDNFIEVVCAAIFVNEKLDLFQSVTDAVSLDSFADKYIMPLYQCDDSNKLLDWLACTAVDAVATLTKYLLVNGFYHSETGDLRQFIRQCLNALSEYALSKSQPVSAPKQKWVI